MRVLAYEVLPPAFHPHDPRAPDATAAVAALITGREPALTVEHVGSSAVPGCGGKGILDLAVLYPEGGLEGAKAALAGLGFRPQTTRDPFPETRPLRTGAVEFGGRSYRIHAHVIRAGCAEHLELARFRDALRADPALRVRYETVKRAVLSAGVRDGVDYAEAKSGFVREVLGG